MSAPCIAVAYSGGRDSTALLHATRAEAARHGGGVRVLALHVHHGLSPDADTWLAHCEAQCARWSRRGQAVEFHAHRVAGGPAAGDSVEAWARQARYRALREMALAQGASVVLLAHHQRDQAETWLLQALRGAGTAGLSGMPRTVERDGIVWQRPWLARSRAEIDAYVRRHRLAHIDDDSNDDPRFARNRLRLMVWPALSSAFPSADAALATAAQWSQQADTALAELAILDLATIASPAGLSRDGWLALSPARRSNALRAWLKTGLGTGMSASLAERLLAELPASRVGRWPVGAGELRLYRGRLTLDAAVADSAVGIQRVETLRIEGPGRYPLAGWGGALRVEAVAENGVPMAWLAHIMLRERAGAERFQAGIGRPPRSLKKQFQAAAVPAWARRGPLLYSGGQLVFVPGLGLDARVIGLPGQPLVALRWLPEPSGD